MASSDLQKNDFMTLACWMAGEFSNAKQANAQPQSYAHIHVFFRPLPFEFFDGVGFYSEQVYDYDLWAPYRQGIHRLVDRGDSIYIENYGLIDPILYAGAAREPSILNTIHSSSIERRLNCSMIFERKGKEFLGRVEGNQCLIPKEGRLTFLVSEVVLTESTWDSLDQGFDIDTQEKVWGSGHGALRFDKRQDFSHELNGC
jgi:CpeT protein